MAFDQPVEELPDCGSIVGSAWFTLGMSEASDLDFLRDLHRLVRSAELAETSRPGNITRLGALVAAHLGVPAEANQLLSMPLPAHRLVDADLALSRLAEADPAGTVVGISGFARHEDSLAALLVNEHTDVTPGAVEHTWLPTGPETRRQVVSNGVRLFRVDERPVAVWQRAADPRTGDERATVQVAAAEAADAEATIARVQELMVELSVLRGKVVSFTGNEFQPGMAGITFHERPRIASADIVLPDGVLDRVVRHAVGIGQQAAALRRHGQHLKRGLLLYGPPGTGKTLTVRHLLGEAEATTCILLSGNSLNLVTAAAELARAMQPALVVLEDVDLVAADREFYSGPQPLLFAILDALDGLDGDADVAFVLTTNRADLLEPALAQRPGRVDLAVEIPLPDETARRRLFELYAAGLPFSPETVVAVADSAAGVTASFAKEAVRRAVLTAALADREPADADLHAAVAELLTSSAGLTRTLLGAVEAGHPHHGLLGQVTGLEPE